MEENPTRLQRCIRYIIKLQFINWEYDKSGFYYGVIGYSRELLKGRKVKFIGFREGIIAAIFEDWK